MPIRFSDDLASSGPFPVVGADEIGGVVTDVSESGGVVTVTKKDASNKGTTGTNTFNLAGQTGGLNQNQVDARIAQTNVYRVVRFTRTQNDTVPPVPTSNAVPNAVSTGTWTSTYNRPNNTEKYTWAAIKIGIATDPANNTEWVIIPLEQHVAGGGGGLTQTQVDARVQALVEDWAEVGDSTTLPNAKIADNAITKSKMADDSVGIAELDATGTTAGSKVLKTNAAGNALTWADDQTGSGGGGLTTTQVDARIQTWARAGNTDNVPANKLDESAIVNSRVANAAPENIGVVDTTDDNGYEKDGAAITTDASPTRWADQKHRHPWREHEAEVFNSFDGNKWEDTAQGEIRTIDGADLRPYTEPDTNTIITDNALLTGFHWSATPSDLTPRSDNNRRIYLRVPLSAEASGSWRINFETGDGTATPQTRTLSDDQTRDTIYEVNRNATHIYYAAQYTSVPSDARMRVQEFDKFMLDLDRVDVSNIAARVHINERPGATVLQDGPGAGMALTNWQTNNVRSAGGFSDFSPAFDLDDANNQYGEFLSEITLRMSGRSSTSIGFNTEHDTVHRITDFAFASALRGTTAYSSGSVEGLAIGSVDLYDASTKAGTITVYLAKNALNQVGYYYRYTVETSPAYQGTASSSISSNISVAFEHGDVPEVPSGGGGGTGSLTRTVLASDVIAPFDGSTANWGAWTNVFTHTVAAAEVGINNYNVHSHVQYSDDNTPDGAKRIFAEERITRTRSSVATTLTEVTHYIRNANWGPTGNTETTEHATRNIHTSLSVWDTAVAGDVITHQARAARQDTASDGSLSWKATNTAFELYHSP